jgi:hypothetical protein
MPDADEKSKRNCRKSGRKTKIRRRQRRATRKRDRPSPIGRVAVRKEGGRAKDGKSPQRRKGAEKDHLIAFAVIQAVASDSG